MEKEKVSKEFKKTIQEYLEKRAIQDPLFAVTYAKPNKNIDDCITYILNYVKDSKINGFTDDEIFGKAVHYYDEDDINVGKPIPSANIVVNHVIELTEEEKQQAREKARAQAEADAYKQMTTRTKPAAKSTKNNLPQQPTLF